MNLTVARRGAEYIYKLCVKGSTRPEQIPFYPQKPLSAVGQPPVELPKKSSPEREGISSAYLSQFLEEVEADPGSRVRNLLLYRNGRLLLSASAPGYSPKIWAQTHSMAKTVTAMGLAILINRGQVSLDSRLVDILEEDCPPRPTARMKSITLRHLLTMTAGVTDVGEGAAVTVENWKKAFLSSSVSTQPGKRFFYNSMNTYMLSAVIEKVSGMGLEQFLRENLLHPMGIHTFFCEKSPEGIGKGGWGMFLAPPDMAKLGQLLLQGGQWEGRQLVPRDFLVEATKSQVVTGEDFGTYNYGYHIWVARDGSSYLYNGMLGQNVWVNPHTRMVVVFTAGNDEFFQRSSTTDLINRYFGAGYAPAESLRPNPQGVTRLRRREENFLCARLRLPCTGRHMDYFSPAGNLPLPQQVEELLHRDFYVEENNAGILPLGQRMIQNNHSGGIRRLSFAREDRKLYLTLQEGEALHRLEVGVDRFGYTELTLQGEKYLVGVLLSFRENEDGVPLARMEFVFPELPGTRTMKLYYRGPKCLLLLSETPGIETLDRIISSITVNAAVKPWVGNFVRERFQRGIGLARLLHCMEPVLYVTEEAQKGKKPPHVHAAIATQRRLREKKTKK